MRTNKIVLIGNASIFAAAISGCSTPGALRNTTPDIVANSIKSAKTVAICITDRWENGAGYLGTTVPVSMRETEKGYTVMWLNGMGGAGMLADIDNTASGSRTLYYRGGVIGSGTFEASLRECQ
ncbi:hypothetical protein [Noviherbaspirillum galbum]|uniref:Lipoprotein n=1 Tax=Noviherbaspirillum galbum TaxID=2709383 RepID=A0A6B3SR21_9BURK|nr:hypothetical protein [Noviherbaspirillum galbum]NEX60109.1 hypothetical protein [Noviherbaspirillum galbum]